MHDFAFLRPSLLPEDLRYMGASVAQIQSSAPGFPPWLGRVFGVLGGYMFATGLLSVYVAEYFLVTTDQVKHVIDSTLPLFSLTSIAFVLNKTGDIGYGYFWVYSVSYAVFYLILACLFLIVGLTAQPTQVRTVPIRMYLGSISVTIICLVFCFGLLLGRLLVEPQMH